MSTTESDQTQILLRELAVTFLITRLRGLWHGEPTTWDSPEALAATLWAALPPLHPSMRRACAYFAASGQQDHPLYRAMAPLIYRSGETLLPTADKMPRFAQTEVEGSPVRRAVEACYKIQMTPAPLPINSQLVGCFSSRDFPRAYIDKSAIPPDLDIAAAGSRYIYVIEHRPKDWNRFWRVGTQGQDAQALEYMLLYRDDDHGEEAMKAGITAQDLARADSLEAVSRQIDDLCPVDQDVSVFLRRFADNVLQPFLNDHARRAERDDVERAVAVLRQWAAPAVDPDAAPVPAAARRPRRL